MWEHFFEREKRYLNPYIKKMDNYKKYIKYLKEDIEHYKGRWKTYFSNENPLCVEIGSGAGNFLVKNAVKYPEKNFLGVEIRFKRLVLSAQKSEKRDLNNLLFMRRRGENILDFLAEDEMDSLYINFPDPWDKKKKRRIMTVSLFEKLKTVMRKGGKLYFKTDHDEYYQYVLDIMKNVTDFKVVYQTSDLHNSEKDSGNLRTEFEDLFTKKGINTNYIEIEKEV